MAISANAMHLENRLGDVETDCCNRLHAWLLQIVGALTAPTFMALMCRWRSRPQHQQRTHAPQQTAALVDHLVGGEQQLGQTSKPSEPGRTSKPCALAVCVPVQIPTPIGGANF